MIRTETWSLSTRDDQVGGAVICFAVTALTLPLAVILNPGLLWVWVFVGPVLLVAGIAQLINPYEVEIVPSGALRFISVTKTDEFSCAEVRRIVRQENRSNHTLRQFRVDHAGRVAIVHGVKAEPLYQRLLKLPTLTPAVQVSVEEYDDSD